MIFISQTIFSKKKLYFKVNFCVNFKNCVVENKKVFGDTI